MVWNHEVESKHFKIVSKGLLWSAYMVCFVVFGGFGGPGGGPGGGLNGSRSSGKPLLLPRFKKPPPGPPEPPPKPPKTTKQTI